MTAIDSATARAVLDLPMQANDAGAATIRDYLVNLLAAVWDDGEGFSGKQPFGNSGWEFDLYIPLVKAGLIEGRLDKEGFLDEVDDQAGHRLIAAAIEAMRTEPGR